MGRVYSYMIVPTDCWYEQNVYPQKPWEDERFGVEGVNAAFIEGVYAGRLEQVTQNNTLYTPLTVPMGVSDDWVQPFFPHGHYPSVVFTVQR